MQLKLIATLSLAALLGCSGVPPLSIPGSPDAGPRGQKVQGILSTQIESATIAPSSSQVLRAGLAIVRLIPSTEMDAVPVGSAAVWLKRYDEDESHYELAASLEEATMLAVFAQTHGQPHPQLSVTRGSTPARSISVFDRSVYQFAFPKETSGALTLSVPTGSSLYLAVPISQVRVAFTSSYTVSEEELQVSSNVKDATITFKVTDAQGKAVPGISKEHFILHLYTPPAAQEDEDPGEPMPIVEFADLGDGQYRISSLVEPKTATGSLRFRIDVANPPITTEASFYRH
jgi:hypothetical protein